jgi:phytoene dehydrogenase-like protein
VGPGRPLNPRRRALLGGAAALALAGCGRDRQAQAPWPVDARWLGADAARGHRLRQGGPLPQADVQRRAGALVLGGGIAGLAAARACVQRGIDDVAVFELEDAAGGNARATALGGIACPLGAHYLPLPTPDAHEVAEWLHQIGLLRTDAAGRTVADERHLCHSPQERVFVDGAWTEGLLPPMDPSSATAAQARRFAAAVRRLRGDGRAFTIPAHRARWNAELDALDRTTFADWLAANGITDTTLRWYLDYCCRDDFGADAGVVSAWAGVHYFASRHGFAAPGDTEHEAEAVFTWPDGNAWLVARLLEGIDAARVHTGRTVLRVAEQRHGVEVLAWDDRAQRAEAWQAPRVVVALPLAVAARVVESPPAALRDAVQMQRQAPWLVANLLLDRPPLARTGAAPAWDNVIFGSTGLGYVDATHQQLRGHAGGPTVLTAYHALRADERTALLAGDAAAWAHRVLAELEPVHPDLRQRVQRVVLARWGHAMAVPTPGAHRHPALQALRAMKGRVRYAHADLAGYSVFEEAFTAGHEAAAA